MKKLAEYSTGAISDAILSAVDDLVFPVKRPNEFTITEFMEAVEAERGLALTYSQATYRLNRMVEEGRLLKGYRLNGDDARRVACYWQPTEDECPPDMP